MKTLGIFILFISVLSYGLSISYKTKTEIAQLKEFLSLMKYIKNQIKYFNKPLCEIYCEYALKSSYLSDFLNNLNNFDWKNAFDNTDGIFISKNAKEILVEFGNKLGKNDCDGQIEICDYYITIFEKEVQNASDNYPKKSKLCISLSIYAGLLLIIILM